jgi:hypothetical protein
MIDIGFKKDNFTTEDAFWIMYYFLEKHYTLSKGQFDLSDILSASQPTGFDEAGHFNLTNSENLFIAPADRSMIEYWNEAVDKYKSDGRPGLKKFMK